MRPGGQPQASANPAFSARKTRSPGGQRRRRPPWRRAPACRSRGKLSAGEGGPIGYASSAIEDVGAPRDRPSENTATEAIPCSRHARITRTAISPRFATRTLVNLHLVVPSAPSKRGRPLFPEGLHALPGGPRSDEDRLTESSRESGRCGGRRSRSSGSPAWPDRAPAAALAASRAASAPALAHELGIFPRLGSPDRCASASFGGLTILARQHELLGAPEPDQLDQPGAASDTGDEPPDCFSGRAKNAPKRAAIRRSQASASSSPSAEHKVPLIAAMRRLLERFEIVEEEAREQPRVGAEYRRVPVRLERRHVSAHAKRSWPVPVNTTTRTASFA